MQVTKALLVKFIGNKCSREEAELVHEYLVMHPQAIDELLNDEQWELYNSTGVLDKQRSDAWYENIQKQKGSAQIIKLRKWVEIAAAAVVLMTGSLFIYQALKSGKKKASPVVATVRPVEKTPGSEKRKFTNNSNQPVTYALADGSVITLYKNSTVICEQPFTGNKRNLELHGEALFKVAKDKTRPFTVYTKNFSTTALGTVFNINAYDNKRKSAVKLISGKVVVKNLIVNTDPVYLNPGEECVFEFAKQQLELHAVKAETPASKPTLIHHDQVITENEEAIEFTNAPLQQVFNKIENLYHVSIHIEAKHLENRKFTGTHFKRESPDTLLNTIAGLNNLLISKEGTVYLLKYNE
jgi:ferric-dicitrate binding protein FerR (iron transport regulator)